MSNTSQKFSKRFRKSQAMSETEQEKERKIYLGTTSFTYSILLYKYIYFYANLCTNAV